VERCNLDSTIPILDDQSWYLIKVTTIARHKRCSLGKSDGGDAQILRPNAKPLTH